METEVGKSAGACGARSLALMGLPVDERWKEQSAGEVWAIEGFASGWGYRGVNELQGLGR